MAKVLVDKSILNKINKELKIGVPDYSGVNRSVEDQIDFEVVELLKQYFDKSLIKLHKTGDSKIDNYVPSYHGSTGRGQIDVGIYNFLGKNELSVLIEDKSFDSTEDPIPQAIHYATVLNKKVEPIRVIIGNHPAKDLDVRVLVKDTYESLVINGEKVKGFIGPEILSMIYSNPDISNFVVEEKVGKHFGQKEFHNIINKLKQIYRSVTEIGNNDDVSINFTVSFIALKMIMEKQGKKWSTIKEYADLKNEVDLIIGDKANFELNKKYKDIFVVYDEKTKKESFNFSSIIETIDLREFKDKVENSALTSIIKILNDIPEGDLPIDLFGEVYETLASKKTKSVLGEFFTRRHIIQTIVRMFLTENDIQNIVEHRYKIADPACGTGGFLTESFKYIKSYCEKEHPKLDISKLASEIVVGYDINPNNVGRTRINMTLAGDGFSDIRSQNTLLAKDFPKGIKYVMTNVPYGTKGDIAVSDENSPEEFIKSNNNKRLELNFIIKIIEMLDKGGKASVIVPEGLLETPTLAAFRDYLLRYCKLTTVISLPKFAFAPYTKWKTYVIFIEKRNTPLKSIDDISDNERTWCYIVDNDGYANSDKRFPTKLISEDGSWKHDELSCYVDINGVNHLSKIENAFLSEAEDTIGRYTNEWDEEIIGKKYGFIRMKDIKDKKTVKNPTLSEKEVNSRLKIEALNQSILNDELYDILLSSLTPTKKGYKVSKNNYIENKELKEEFIEIFETMQIEYNSDDKKFYDLSREETTYLLPLIPEKYFRKKEVKEISLYELKMRVDSIEQELKCLFGGGLYENK